MMAFGRGPLDKFAAAVEKVIGKGETPKAILLSAGGNDIDGAEFGFLLNHAGSPREGLNESVAVRNAVAIDVEYVNLRSVLPATKTIWANELHPKELRFKLAAEKFAALL
jgi:hypothetical protein